MGASVIIAAAGKSSRMGMDKILCKIDGKEVITYSLNAFLKAKCVDEIIVVTLKDKISKIEKIVKELKAEIPIKVCEGSDSRQKSVICGLDNCNEKSECVMIHDAARPMITDEYIDLLYDKVIQEGLKAAALGVPLKDTVKQIDESGKILETLDRNYVYAVQTPQAFEMNLYKKAINEAIKSGKDYTDDCQLVEAVGESVYMIKGEYKNFKLTTYDDIISAEKLLKEQKND